MKSVAFVTYNEWAAYRTHAMVSIFVGPVYYLAQVFIWRALYSGPAAAVGAAVGAATGAATGAVVSGAAAATAAIATTTATATTVTAATAATATASGAIAGMTLDMMLAYFGVTAVIGYLTMDFADWNFQMLVRTGKYLTFLLRPVHHRFFALSQKIGHRCLGFLFEFLPVYLIFVFVFRVRLVPASWLWTILSLACAYLTVFYTNYSIGLLAFWLTQTRGVRNVFSFLVFALSGQLIPLTLLPDAAQRIIFFMPFQFISYVPVRVFLGSYSLAGVTLPIPAVVGMQFGVVIFCAALSELLYRRGIKRFMGVGV